jgi:hypothetical protein
MSKRLTAAVLFGALTASTAGYAQGLSFQEIDGDQDGFLTYDEVLAAVPTITPDVFKAIDTDQDALLNPDEFSSLQL